MASSWREWYVEQSHGQLIIIAYANAGAGSSGGATQKEEQSIQSGASTNAASEVVSVALLQSRRRPVECDGCSVRNAIVQFFELRRRCSSAA